MAESSPTVSELFKSKFNTVDDVNRLVRAALDGARDKASLADGYAVDLRAAVEASAFAKSVLGGKDSDAAERGADGDPAGTGGEGVSVPEHEVERTADGSLTVRVGRSVVRN